MASSEPEMPSEASHQPPALQGESPDGSGEEREQSLSISVNTDELESARVAGVVKMSGGFSLIIEDDGANAHAPQAAEAEASEATEAHTGAEATSSRDSKADEADETPQEAETATTAESALNLYASAVDDGDDHDDDGDGHDGDGHDHDGDTSMNMNEPDGVVECPSEASNSDGALQNAETPDSLSDGDSTSGGASMQSFDVTEENDCVPELPSGDSFMSGLVGGGSATSLLSTSSGHSKVGRRGSLREPRYKAVPKKVEWQLPEDHTDRSNDPPPPRPKRLRRRILLEGQSVSQLLVLYSDMCKRLKVRQLKPLVRQLQDIIAHNEPLVHALSFKGITAVTDPKRWHSIWEVLINCPQLHELSFEGCNLTDRNLFSLSRGLLMRRSIRFLHIGNNHLKPRGLESLIRLLSSSPYLRVLDLSGNPIDKKRAFVLGRAVAVACNLDTLIMQRCALKTQHALDLLVQALTINRTVRTWDIQKNHIDSKGAHLISALLMRKNLLERIDLRDNELGDVGAELLASALRVNTSIRALALAGNNIHEMGFFSIFQALGRNRTLEVLDLSHNPGATPLAMDAAKAMLLTQPALRKLKLNNVKLNALGCISLAEALSDTVELREVSLEGNKLEVAGMMAIAQALRGNYHILEVMYSRLSSEPSYCADFRHELSLLLERNRELALERELSRLNEVSQVEESLPRRPLSPARAQSTTNLATGTKPILFGEEGTSMRTPEGKLVRRHDSLYIAPRTQDNNAGSTDSTGDGAAADETAAPASVELQPSVKRTPSSDLALDDGQDRMLEEKNAIFRRAVHRRDSVMMQSRERKKYGSAGSAEARQAEVFEEEEEEEEQTQESPRAHRTKRAQDERLAEEEEDDDDDVEYDGEKLKQELSAELVPFSGVRDVDGNEVDVEDALYEEDEEGGESGSGGAVDNSEEDADHDEDADNVLPMVSLPTPRRLIVNKRLSALGSFDDDMYDDDEILVDAEANA